MARNWIVVGDPTSSGGSVITGSPFTDIDGIPVARVTDQASCPRHKGAYPIVDGDSTMIVDGQPVALHGSSLSCGCKVLSAQQTRVFVDQGAAAEAKAAASPAIAAAAAASTSAAASQQPLQAPAEIPIGLGTSKPVQTADPQKARDAVRDANSALREAGAYRAYDTEVEAARAWRDHVLPVADDHQVEIGALISQTPDEMYHLGPAYSQGAYNHVNGLIEHGQKVHGNLTAYVHTHPHPNGLVGEERALAFNDRLTRMVLSDGSVELVGGIATGPDSRGDLVSAYDQELNVYICDSAGLHGWNFQEYVKRQRREIGLIPLGAVYRRGQ